MNPAARSFREEFQDAVDAGPNRPALIDARDEAVYDYAALDALTRRWATVFQSHPTEGKDAVASILPNSVEQLSAFLATVRYGCGFAPISCDSTPREVDAGGSSE